ncbi:MAG: dihydroneopterin aldolase [Aphanocapsa sp. GSE-SYN-MK-11-07L]|jgi:dihydroneopterin aldolase|nr:dihydroneopterin aldolase [Aphanocapsa sp. GSE-SYN-MK-11-07L]
MDCIHLRGIRGYGYTGVLPAEKALGQWFEVELKLWLDLSQPGQSDRLADTLDYRTVIASVQHLLKTARFELLERLATAIADAALASGSVQQVEVQLTKLAPPIPDFAGQITIILHRQRPSNFTE